MVPRKQGLSVLGWAGEPGKSGGRRRAVPPLRTGERKVYHGAIRNRSSDGAGYSNAAGRGWPWPGQAVPGRFPMSTPAKCILLVDDEAGLRQLLITTLAAPELAIAQAGSGEQALRLARELHPDLIILDVRLNPPVPDGLEVCRQVKGDPQTRRSKVLVLTGG